MSQYSIRSAVPPRDLAATITAQAVTRAGWAVALVYLLGVLISLVDLWISRGYGASVGVSFVALVAVIGALVAVIHRPTMQRGAMFLAVSTVASFVFCYGLLLADPGLNDSATYLLNRITVAMVLIGSVGATLISGVWWCSVGFLLGTIATAAAQLTFGLALTPGFGPAACLVIYLVVIVMFVLIRNSQRRFTPDFLTVEAETARMAGQRELEERAVALVHDTVLNDLAAIAHGRDQLDERMRDRIARDIFAVESAQTDPASLTSVVVAGQLRDELFAVLSEFQWRGLSVDVSGGEALSAELDPDTGAALVNAVSGCLENVLRHSGSNSAEIFVDATDDSLSVMVVDQGQGFEPKAVPKGRLGIRQVLVKSIERCGGTVRIWSALGAGTSVVITVPIEVGHD